MKKFIFVASLGVILSACSTDVAPENTPETEEIATAEVQPNQVLTMEIDGMVCQMGCGGSIRKGLKGTNGVASVEFDFEEERKTNIAKIAFDKSIVTSEQLIKVVADLNDGQFLVGTVSFEDVAVSVKSNKTKKLKDGDNSSKVDVSSSTIKFPNLLDVFSGLLK